MKSGFLFFMFSVFYTGAFAGAVEVSTVHELLMNFRSGTTIKIKPGVYKLEEAINANFDNVVFEETYDGKEAAVYYVKNVKLIGAPGVKILAKPRYGWVFKFKGCENWTIENITFGHEEEGYCTGGVMSIHESKNFTLKNCKLFGSGTIGLDVSYSSGVKMQGGEIYECTYGLLSLIDAKKVSFNGTIFRNTGEFDLIYISSGSVVSFTNCAFNNNFTSEYFPYLFNVDGNEGGNASFVSLKKCSFTGNRIKWFCNNNSLLKISGCTFSNNTFAQPK